MVERIEFDLIHSRLCDGLEQKEIRRKKGDRQPTAHTMRIDIVIIVAAFFVTTMATPATTTNTDASAPLSKTVYLIRHAESEENRRLGSLKSMVRGLGRFALPSRADVGASLELLNVTSQVDSAVSIMGTRQITSMAAALQASNFVTEQSIELVAHSPLERARQTSQGLLGCMAPDLKAPSVQRVTELDILKEKYPSEWIPGNYASFQSRIDEFEAWLHQQPERTVCVVGHSQYFKAMLGLDFKFRNCDVWQVQFNGLSREQSTADPTAPACATTTNPVDIDGTTYNLPSAWSGLTKLHTCVVAVEDSENNEDSSS